MRRNADAQRDDRAGAGIAERDIELHDRLAQPFGDRAGRRHVGLRHDDGELLAAIAGREIGRPDRGLADHAGDRAQAFVAALMAVPVVEQLEMIDVGK